MSYLLKLTHVRHETSKMNVRSLNRRSKYDWFWLKALLKSLVLEFFYAHTMTLSKYIRCILVGALGMLRYVFLSYILYSRRYSEIKYVTLSTQMFF